jgi:hypothetical protein
MATDSITMVIDKESQIVTDKDSMAMGAEIRVIGEIT